MAFIRSLLTDKEKNCLIKKYNLLHPYDLKKSAVLVQQVFDFKRDIRLLPLCKMEDDRLTVFVFIFEKKLCSICAYYRYKRKNDGFVSVNWNIIKLYCPKDIELTKYELISLIKEGFYVLKYGFSLGVNETVIEKIGDVDYVSEDTLKVCQNYLIESGNYNAGKDQAYKNRYPMKIVTVSKSSQAGFIYSIITNDEKKELMNKYNFGKYGNNFSTNVYSIMYNARLIRILGQELHGNAPAVLAFIWEDNLCCILAYQRYIKRSDIIDSIQWDIESIHVPKKLECQKDKLLFLLKEAFEAFKVDEKNKIILGEIKKLEFEDKKGWYYESEI